MGRRREGCNSEDQHIMAFGNIYQLNSFLKDYLKTGDLVLLKGAESTDHLQRIVLSRTGDITCWQDRCEKQRFCEDCRFLRSPALPVCKD